MQNLYTFSIIAPVSSLYPYTSLAILLSKFALHVHNTSNYAFCCKYVNREKYPASLRKQKNKNKKVLLGLEPQTLGSDPQLCFQSTTFILTAPSNRLIIRITAWHNVVTPLCY